MAKKDPTLSAADHLLVCLGWARSARQPLQVAGAALDLTNPRTATQPWRTLRWRTDELEAACRLVEAFATGTCDTAHALARVKMPAYADQPGPYEWQVDPATDDLARVKLAASRLGEVLDRAGKAADAAAKELKGAGKQHKGDRRADDLHADLAALAQTLEIGRKLARRLSAAAKGA